MRHLKFWLLPLLAITVLAVFTSCSDDDDDDLDSAIVGSWSGTTTYYNPVGGTTYHYLSIDLYSDNTGKLVFEKPTSFTAASFMYRISGKRVICEGASAGSDGGLNEHFSLTLAIERDRLLPQDTYTSFILTRDGSVMTDLYGNEIIDDSELLHGVWVNADGSTVVEIFSSSYNEYILTSPYSKEYKTVNTGAFSYSPERKKVWFHGTEFDIITLDSNTLKVASTSGTKILTYKRGKQSDVPNKGNIENMLVSHYLWSDSKGKHAFAFNSKGTVTYMETSNVTVGSYGNASLTATGTYTVNGNTVKCNFKKVSWEGGDLSKYANIFPGWTYEQSCTKTYIFTESGNNLIVTMPNGDKITLYPN